MADICSMCKKPYHSNTEEEFFLTEELPICPCCGEKLDSLVYSESVSAYRDARKYIEKIQAVTADSSVRETLKQLLADYPEPEAEPESATVMQQLQHVSSFSAASGNDLPYVVYQVTLKEKLIGTGSGNLTELESVLNHFYAKGYRLHTMSTSTSGSKGGFGGDRIQATLVFEKAELFK